VNIRYIDLGYRFVGKAAAAPIVSARVLAPTLLRASPLLGGAGLFAGVLVGLQVINRGKAKDQRFGGALLDLLGL